MKKSPKIASSTLPCISSYQYSNIQTINRNPKSKTTNFSDQSNPSTKQRDALSMICIDTNDLPQYKYIPPRPPKYIRLNILQNSRSHSVSSKTWTSKTLPLPTNQLSNSNTETLSNPIHTIKSMQLENFDNSDYCYDASVPRVPELPVKMKIRGSSYRPFREKPRIQDSYLKPNNLRFTTHSNQRVQLTANQSEQLSTSQSYENRPKTSIERTQLDSTIEETEKKAKTSSRIGTQSDSVVHDVVYCRPRVSYQKMAVKYFLDAGDDIGCFSTEVHIPLPSIYQKATIKYQGFDSPNPPTTSPRSILTNPDENRGVF